MPDGQLVRFPEGTPNETIRSAIQSKYPDFGKPSLGTIADRALGRGTQNLAATFKDDLPAYLASILGQDEYAVEQLEEGRARRQAAAEKFPTQYGSYEDVGSLGDAVGFITEKTSEFAPYWGGYCSAAACLRARPSSICSTAYSSCPSIEAK